MCDTQVLLHQGVTWFAKNSDREPDEPQLVLRLPPVANDYNVTVRTTYLQIPQARRRYGVILSKPAWMWGAEMGVNDQGVAIGNEAIFSRVRSRKPEGLLGMDLLRLGLERGASAQQATGVIIEHLERYGQGGAAGYRDKRFCYDSSFLICDPAEAVLLETAGRHWVLKRVGTEAAVSNRLTIGSDFEHHSAGLHEFARKQNLWHGHETLHFARTFDGQLLPRFARAEARQTLGLSCLRKTAETGPTLEHFARHLRSHAFDGDGYARASNADMCMHAAGLVRRSQTTGSLVARIARSVTGLDLQILVTGTSAPCLSLFRPVSFDYDISYSVLASDQADPHASPWWHFEPLHRRALFDAKLRTELRTDRDAIEARLFSQAATAAQLRAADQLCREWDKRNQRRLGLARQRPARLTRYWSSVSARDGVVI